MRLMMIRKEKDYSIPALETNGGSVYNITALLKEYADNNRFLTAGVVSLDLIFLQKDPFEVIEYLKSNLNKAIAIDNKDLIFDVPLRNGDIVCVGRSYAEHAKELNNPIPSEPILFSKPRSSLIANDEKIVVGENPERTELEGEIALVIGKDISGNIDPSEAEKAVLGITLVNDITDRAKQNKLKESGKPWFVAKGKRTFCPCGPAITLMHDGINLDNIQFKTILNGNTCQEGNTKDWLWPAGELLAAIASNIQLKSGDIVSTGTPKGVTKLKPGDSVSVECDLVGELRNEVVV